MKNSDKNLNMGQSTLKKNTVNSVKVINNVINQMTEADFDEYGFAVWEKFYVPNLNTGRHTFFTNKPESVIYRHWADGLVRCNNSVVIDIHQTQEDFEKDFNALAGKNIVETIKHLLRAHPSQTLAILRAMPTCLYQNEAVTLQILSCVKRTDEIIHDATTAIAEKMDVLKTYQELKNPQHLSTNQQFDAMIKTYRQGKKQLSCNEDKNK